MTVGPWYHGIASDASMTLSPVSALTGMTVHVVEVEAGGGGANAAGELLERDVREPDGVHLVDGNDDGADAHHGAHGEVPVGLRPMPRVASTSRIAMSAVDAATAMLRVYCSCPGASAMIARRPDGR
jgi:hypothetical protein